MTFFGRVEKCSRLSTVWHVTAACPFASSVITAFPFLARDCLSMGAVALGRRPTRSRVPLCGLHSDVLISFPALSRQRGGGSTRVYPDQIGACASICKRRANRVGYSLAFPARVSQSCPAATGQKRNGRFYASHPSRMGEDYLLLKGRCSRSFAFQRGADSRFCLPTKAFWDSSACRPAKGWLVVRAVVGLVGRVPCKALLPCDTYSIPMGTLDYKYF